MLLPECEPDQDMTTMLTSRTSHHDMYLVKGQEYQTVAAVPLGYTDGITTLGLYKWERGQTHAIFLCASENSICCKARPCEQEQDSERVLPSMGSAATVLDTLPSTNNA